MSRPQTMDIPDIAPVTAAGHLALGAVVEALCQPRAVAFGQAQDVERRMHLPSRDQVIDTVKSLHAVLFPGYFSHWDLSQDSVRFYVGATLDRIAHVLYEQVRRALCFSRPDGRPAADGCRDRALEITQAFVGRLPVVQRMLDADVLAGYEGDPAATGPEEIIFSYPGLRAIIDYRLAHELHVLGTPLIPRIITEYAHSLTGVDIHPGATIGERFFIDHGTGVVIGETAVIGRNVRLYQGVTLGAKSFPLDQQGNPIKGIPRHPVVEDDVVIYSGATILGRITIGRGSFVGGNVWLTRSVPPGSMVTQNQVKLAGFEGGDGI